MKKKYTVRVVYIVPLGAKPWKEMRHRATEYLEDIQWFFADEMNRHGFGKKTFEIARDSNGELLFHQINDSLDRSQFKEKPWNECKKIAEANDLRGDKDIVTYVFEYYSFPSGKDPVASCRGGRKKVGGEVFLSSLHIKLARREWLSCDDEYEGQVFDWIRPEPMGKDTLNWHGRGRKIGDVCGASYGIIAHELGHAFGLHDTKNGRNRKGDLMGYGIRGMRGYFRPDLTDDFCVLTEKDAACLNNSKFFSKRNLKNKSLAFGL